MSVTSGQPVSSSVVNAAFVSRTQDTSTVGKLTISNVTESTDKDTGALIVEGGVGIEKNLNVGGNATFAGDLTVLGTTTTINSTVTEIEDAAIVLNSGGNDATADGSGLIIERTTTNGTIVYDQSLSSKFKCGNVGSESEIVTAATIVTTLSPYPKWYKYTVLHSALQAASLTNDINLFLLPAKAIISQIAVKHDVQFAGTGITKYELSIGVAGNLQKYTDKLDVSTAVAADNGWTFIGGSFESFTGATSIRLSATSTGANLDQSTAGSVEIYVLYTTLP